MDALAIISFVVGLVALLVAVPGAWREWQKRRWHVLDVSAHVERHLAPVPGEANTNALVGGTLTMENKGVHPVTNVHMLGPETLASHPSTYRPAIAPGQRVDIELTAERMMALPVDHWWSCK